MQKELNHFKAQRSKLDDAGPRADRGDRGATPRSAASEATASQHAEADWQADQEELRRGQGAGRRRDASSGRRARRAGTADMDSGNAGPVRDAARRAKAGRAVARVERGTCQGCRITLPTHLVQRVRAGGMLVQCPSCERILVAG